MDWLLKLIKPLILKFMNWDGYRWFMLKVMPRLRLTNKYTQLPGTDYRVAYDRLRSGDIIFTRDKNNMATKVLGGTWSHAALCIGKDPSGKEVEIAEMLGDGYTETDFYTLAKEADELAIIRCDDFDEEYIEKMIKKTRTFKGTPYDTGFQMNSGQKAFYCSEMVYEADFERRLDVDLSDIVGLGVEYLSPTGLFKAKNCSVMILSQRA